ncbi:hypothetical protein SLS55_002604 [Diplodia seriata]|uniref:Uncharacterized protein n=1 Tax=Diplodia seriata TaxID=420778 RepID=A0ABR3CSN6_9PEZI
MYASKMIMAVLAVGAVSVEARPQLVPKPAMLGPYGLTMKSSTSTSTAVETASSVATSTATVVATQTNVASSSTLATVVKSSATTHVTIATNAKPKATTTSSA